MHHTRPPVFRNCKNILHVRKLDNIDQDRFLLFPFQAQLCNLPEAGGIEQVVSEYTDMDLVRMREKTIDISDIVFAACAAYTGARIPIDLSYMGVADSV